MWQESSCVTLGESDSGSDLTVIWTKYKRRLLDSRQNRDRNMSLDMNIWSLRKIKDCCKSLYILTHALGKCDSIPKTLYNTSMDTFIIIPCLYEYSVNVAYETMTLSFCLLNNSKCYFRILDFLCHWFCDLWKISTSNTHQTSLFNQTVSDSISLGWNNTEKGVCDLNHIFCTLIMALLLSPYLTPRLWWCLLMEMGDDQMIRLFMHKSTVSILPISVPTARNRPLFLFHTQTPPHEQHKRQKTKQNHIYFSNCPLRFKRTTCLLLFLQYFFHLLSSLCAPLRCLSSPHPSPWNCWAGKNWASWDTYALWKR